MAVCAQPAMTPAYARAALVRALCDGGCILVMRHARSPLGRPERAAADAQNPGRERQLDAHGRAAAREMGEAIQRLQIPLQRVLVSPSYRTLQTARLVTPIPPVIVPELAAADEHPPEEAGTGDERIAWLRQAVTVNPVPGTDTLIVTHAPNMQAFGNEGAGFSGGETLVLRPERHGVSRLARIRIEEWSLLAGRT